MSQPGREGSPARLLARYAALRRSRRRERRRRERAAEVSFQVTAREAMLPALVESARSRLPACAGPFHKGSLTLSALSQIAAASPADAARLIERYRQLIALRRQLERVRS